MRVTPAAANPALSDNRAVLPAGLPVHQLQAPDGACATIALQGAHVLGWVPAAGREMLYLSPQSGYATGQAIRGGVPVIFPQFSDRGPGRRHGFARVLPWELVRQHRDATHASAVLRLTSGPQTQAFWPHAFGLELTVRVGGGSLAMTLACHNPGPEALRFQAALHTYLRVADLSRCRLRGLQGHRYQDALDRQDKLQPGDIVWGSGDLDQVYLQATGPLQLHDESGPLVELTHEGFEDVVVWNPGAARCAALTDMPADGWRQMACVEAARIGHPVVLHPGGHWQGTQCLTSLADAR